MALAPQQNMIQSILLLSLAISLPIGFRPVYSLFRIPDTLYEAHGNIYRSNGDCLSINSIIGLTINVVGIGAGELQYYTVELAPSITKSAHSASRYLVLVERYNIKHLLQTRTDILTRFMEAGLDANRISRKQIRLKHILGFRDRINK